MIKFFQKEKITLYLRIKAGKLLEYGDGIKSAKTLGKITKDIQIKLYGSTARLIISPPPPPKQGKQQERWYILTNDLTSSREQVLDIYKHRFEIEEAFKDLKHVSKLKKFFIKKRLSFKILLSFVCLAFWIAFWCRKKLQLILTRINSRKKRSYFRVWWENIQRSLRVNLKLLDTG